VKTAIKTSKFGTNETIYICDNYFFFKLSQVFIVLLMNRLLISKTATERIFDVRPGKYKVIENHTTGNHIVKVIFGMNL